MATEYLCADSKLGRSDWLWLREQTSHVKEKEENERKGTEKID
jgi:hypothetical protein